MGEVEKVRQCDTGVTTHVENDLASHDLESGYITDDSVASQRCVGGSVGDSSCAANRVGEICGRCVDGFFQKRQDCTDCSDMDENIGLVLVAIFGAVFFLPFVAYRIFNSGASEYSGMLMMQICFGLFITQNQLATVLSQIYLDLPQIVRDMYNLISAFAFDIQVVPFACLGGSDNGSTRFFLLMASVPMVFGWLFLSSWLTRQVFPPSSSFHMRAPETLNMFGMLYQTLFVVVIISIAQPLQVLIDFTLTVYNRSDQTN